MGEHVAAPDERRLLRERLIAGDEQLRSHYRARLAEIEDAIAAAIADDLGDAPDALRPRLAAAAVMAGAGASPRITPAGCAAARRRARRRRRCWTKRVAFLEGGLAAIAGRPVAR